MKGIFNWKKGVLYALLSAGIFAIILIFAEDERSMSQWLEVRLYLILTASACLLAFRRLNKTWDQQCKKSDYGNENL